MVKITNRKEQTMTRKRKVILQNVDTNGRVFANKLREKGYEVMFKNPDEEDVKPYPFQTS